MKLTSVTPSANKTDRRKVYRSPKVIDFGPVNELTRSGYFSDPQDSVGDGINGDNDFGFFPNY